MPFKCQSRIVREYKRAKADCVPVTYSPDGVEVPNPRAEGLPVCGGDATCSVSAVDEPTWGGSSASLDIKFTCNRCKRPSFPGWTKLLFDNGTELAKYVEQVIRDGGLRCETSSARAAATGSSRKTAGRPRRTGSRMSSARGAATR